MVALCALALIGSGASQIGTRLFWCRRWRSTLDEPNLWLRGQGMVSARGGMRVRLVLCEDGFLTRRVSFQKQLLIGRDEICDLRISRTEYQSPPLLIVGSREPSAVYRSCQQQWNRSQSKTARAWATDVARTRRPALGWRRRTPSDHL